MNHQIERIMTTTANPKRLDFPLSELNSRINKLLGNGFDEYLNTWEKETAHGETDMNHVIYTCIKGHYSGWVVDIYFNERTGVCWLEYSTQHEVTRPDEIKPLHHQLKGWDGHSKRGQAAYDAIFEQEKQQGEHLDKISGMYEEGGLYYGI